jgi:hypothetical protein
VLDKSLFSESGKDYLRWFFKIKLTFLIWWLLSIGFLFGGSSTLPKGYLVMGELNGFTVSTMLWSWKSRGLGSTRGITFFLIIFILMFFLFEKSYD